MTKIILALTVLLSSSFAFAEKSVSITSFYYANQGNNVAELCGKISGADSYPVFINVTVDYKSKAPADYTVTALKDTFCTTVVTRTGIANVQLWN